jgi:uncharacterized repeat protein (TIGR03803 family)
LYGTTEAGGASLCACGTVFKITPGGTLTTLYSFTGKTDGGGPNGGRVQATTKAAIRGRPVEIPVSGLNQPAFRIGAVPTGEPMQRCQDPLESDFEDRALLLGPARCRCSAKVPVDWSRATM